MGDKKIIGVILAAGKGTRIEPFSSRYPKPLLPICNRPLLHYQIEMMKGAGIEEILIVIGHLGYEIARSIGDGGQYGVDIKYIEQSETLGIAHALGKLESFIHSPFLLSLGDVFFITKQLKQMKEIMFERGALGVLAVKYEKDINAIKRNFSILLDNNGTVKRVIEKPRHITNNLKGCGLYLFDQHVFDAIRRTPRTAMRDEYEITDTIQIMVDDGLPVHIAEIVSWDMNITFPLDVLTCNLYELSRLGKNSIIGTSGRIHPNATINNSVIGDGVVVQHPISISDSVIFPKTIISTTHDIQRFIITIEHQIDCRHMNKDGQNEDV